MAQSLFGTDGFRGPFNSSLEYGHVNAPTFHHIAAQYAAINQENDAGDRPYIVGSDTRPSSPVLHQAVVAGLLSAGAEVWDLGVAPTPVVAWAAKQHQAYALAITASHNPAADNGIKLFGAGGVKAASQTLAAVEAHYQGTHIFKVGGQHFRRPEIPEAYLQHITESLGGPDSLRGSSVVIDAANGAAYDLAPRLFEGLGASVMRFACSPDGQHINDNCGAAHLGGVTQFIQQRPDIAASPTFLGAFANDGDGDRVIGVDRRGHKVDGNHWLKQLALGQLGIVGTVYTNTALRQAVEQSGVAFYECANGDSHVTEKLRQLTAAHGPGFTRGGEFTGHLIDTTHIPSGDGLYMAGWLAVELARSGTALQDVYDSLNLWPERMESIRISQGTAPLDNPAVQETIAAAKDQLGNNGRLIVRASGTEPLIRVWGEAPDAARLDQAMHTILSVMA